MNLTHPQFSRLIYQYPLKKLGNIFRYLAAIVIVSSSITINKMLKLSSRSVDTRLYYLANLSNFNKVCYDLIINFLN